MLIGGLLFSQAGSPIFCVRFLCFCLKKASHVANMRNADPAIIIAELMMWAKKQKDGSLLLGARSEPERAVSLEERPSSFCGWVQHAFFRTQQQQNSNNIQIFLFRFFDGFLFFSYLFLLLLFYWHFRVAQNDLFARTFLCFFAHGTLGNNKLSTSSHNNLHTYGQRVVL